MPYPLPWRARARRAGLIAGLVIANWPAVVGAAGFEAGRLATVGSPTDRVSFSGPDATLTVSDGAGRSLTGSRAFGYQGLWVGADGGAGTLTLAFDRALQWLQIDVLGLTLIRGEADEVLTGFVTNAPSQARISSADRSIVWDGSTASPLDEDGRASFRFDATTAGFDRLSFAHRISAPLNGFVINRVSYALAPEVPPPIPEPATMALWLGGALVLWARRRLAHGRTE